MAAGKRYKRFAGHSVNNAGYHNENWDRFFDGNVLYDVGFDSLADAIAYAGTADAKTLYITSSHRLTTSTKIPSNISIVTDKGAKFDLASGVTLTFQGSFDASGNALSDLFTGSGSYVFEKAVSLIGAGTPEGVVTAPVGSQYLRNDGSTSAVLYMKESGTGNTGWSAHASVAGGALTGAGTLNYIPLWTSASTVGNSIASQSGTTITIAGSLTATATITGVTLSISGNGTVGGALGVTGALTVGTNGAASSISINGAAGESRPLYWNRAGTTRWAAQATATSEDWALNAYDSSGVFIDAPISIVNASGGTMTLARPVSMASTLAVTGTVTFSNLAGADTRFVRASSAGLLSASNIAASDLPGSFSGFANPTATIGLTASNGAATTAMRSDAAPALSQSITPTWTGSHAFNAGVFVGTDASAQAVTLRGPAGESKPIYWNSGGTTRWAIQSTATNHAWDLNAYNASGTFIDAPISIVNASGGTMTLARPVSMASTLAVTGTVTFSSALTANAGLIFAGGGSTLSHYETGTWTATLTGMTGSTTFTVYATRIGNMVTLLFDGATGTSNASTMTITGMPSQFRPGRVQRGFTGSFINDGTALMGMMEIATGGTITCYTLLDLSPGIGAGSWTSSGTKGMETFSITYSIA